MSRAMAVVVAAEAAAAATAAKAAVAAEAAAHEAAKAAELIADTAVATLEDDPLWLTREPLVALLEKLPEGHVPADSA